MRRALIAGLVLSFSFVAVSADAATHCVDPKTKKFISCPKPAPKTATTATTTTTAPKLLTLPGPKPATPAPKTAATKPAGPKTCKTGKPCGNACIPKDKVCHIH